MVMVAVLFMLAAGLAGGIVPQYISLSDRGLHRFLALGTGMLLGTIFYHMLPEALHSHSAATFVIVGLLGVFVIERVLVAESQHHSHHHDHSEGGESEPSTHDFSTHSVIGISAFAGLSVHALMVGLGLATQLNDTDAVVPLMTSLLVHKVSEAFSLSTIFLLAGYPKTKSLIMLGLFAAIEPLGIVVGAVAMGILPHGWESGAAGLAAGTFLYVALCDLLPEVFHRRPGRMGSLAMLIVGIVSIALLIGIDHGH